jgi:transposase
MRTTSPRPTQSTVSSAVLYVGLELSTRDWRLAYTTGLDQPVRQTVIPAGDREALRAALGRARATCGLAATAAVWSCHEAGRDGFWPHRLLTAEGVTNTVVDSSSIEIPRRARRTKTDRLDARKLVTMLVRWALGEPTVWHVVHVPSPEAEGERQAPRLLATLTKERTRWRNRIHAALATVGVRLPITARFPEALATARAWDGTPLPAPLTRRVEVAWHMLQVLETERRTLSRHLQAARRAARSTAAGIVERLTQVRGIGDQFAWVMATEVCQRSLTNRREVGALTGFAPAHYRSGEVARDYGMSRAGLPALRRLAVQTAWGWLRWQPTSALTLWYWERFGHGGPGQRRLGIVALARKLVIALWRYVCEGTPPTGAIVRTPSAA